MRIYILTYIKVIFIVLLLCSPGIIWAQEDTPSPTFSCSTLRHIQILRTVTTEFDQFNFEVIVKDEGIILTDRFFYGSANLEFLSKNDINSWLATNNETRLNKEGKYLYITILDGVGVKAISATCLEKKFE